VNLLLDTGVLLRWVGGQALSDAAAGAIADPANVVFVSAGSIWEISIKRSIGKLRVDDEVFDFDREGFEPLAIDAADARAAGELPRHHRDPVDRMLVAQAQARELVLVTTDRRLGNYDADLLLA
jgi:PIN domain nuclease of toxin-antitoxin system